MHLRSTEYAETTLKVNNTGMLPNEKANYNTTKCNLKQRNYNLQISVKNKMY
jgi:hypothetical protein